MHGPKLAHFGSIFFLPVLRAAAIRMSGIQYGYLLDTAAATFMVVAVSASLLACVTPSALWTTVGFLVGRSPNKSDYFDVYFVLLTTCKSSLISGAVFSSVTLFATLPSMVGVGSVKGMVSAVMYSMLGLFYGLCVVFLLLPALSRARICMIEDHRMEKM